MSNTILSRIADDTRNRVQKLKALEAFPRLASRAEASSPPEDFLEAFRAPGPRVLAEVKFASPSEGDIAPGFNPVKVATDYLESGAAALSVLTEPNFFKGDPIYLKDIRNEHAEALLLMKDFILDEYQVYQARALGANAVLILLSLYDDMKLARKLYARAIDLELTPLVEVHTEDELKLASDLGARLIGVNNRDLKTMQVSLETSERLAPKAPKNATLVSESGIKTRADIDHLSKLGYRGFLVGTALMKTGKPGAALRELLTGACS